MIGAPPTMVLGKVDDLKDIDAIIVNRIAAKSKLAQHTKDGIIPLQIGQELELNGNRAVVRGICKNTRTFTSQPIIYTTYSRAIE